MLASALLISDILELEMVLSIQHKLIFDLLTSRTTAEAVDETLATDFGAAPTTASIRMFPLLLGFVDTGHVVECYEAEQRLQFVYLFSFRIAFAQFIRFNSGNYKFDFVNS